MINDNELKRRLNIPIDSDLFSIKEFKEDCDNGLLIDYDGWGNLVSAKTGKSHKVVEPSKAVKWTKKNMPKYEYVIWYNK
jgi:hypothetical protein